MLSYQDLLVRSKSIGSSDIAGIVGENPWESSFDVWLRKGDQFAANYKEQEGNENTNRGSFVEDGVRQWYSKESGIHVVPGGIIYHPFISHFHATPDFKEPVPCAWLPGEIKCPSPSTAHHWGEPGTDEVPDYVLPQCTWHMGCMGASTCTVVKFAGRGLDIYTVRFDGNLFELMVDRAQKFWHDHVLAGVAPPAGSSDRTAKWLEERYPKHRAKTMVDTGTIEHAEIGELMAELKIHREAKNEAEAKEKALKSRVKQLLGESEGAFGDWGKVYWRNSKGRTSYDYARLVADLNVPDEVLERYTRITHGGRAFRPYFAKERGK